MPTVLKGNDRRLIAGRRLERRERRPVERQAALVDHPNESEFGAPEYIDEYGRQYRVAYLTRIGGWLPGTSIPPRATHGRAPIRLADGTLKLWVRLKRGDPSRWWYAGQPRRLELTAVQPGLRNHIIDVRFAFRERPSRRTGYINAVADEDV